MAANFSGPAAAQTKSAKRGLAYGYHSAADMQALAPGLSWWYNWTSRPEASAAGVYAGLNVDYVPMQWDENLNGTTVTAAALAANIPAGARFLLGFNEPNFLSQASLTPAQAAAIWPVLETVARQKNLRLASPAVNYCGNCVSANGVTYNSPVRYLDDFFAACPSCQVDYIAVHTYVCEERYLREKIAEMKKYNKPIWLTEFACGDMPANQITLPVQQKYLLDAVNYLEKEPAIFRYAWFSGRNTEIPFINLLAPTSGQLTALGQEYVGLPAGWELGRLTPVAVTATSQEKATTGPGNATDVDINSRWASAFSDPQSLTLDFGSVQSFARVLLTWEAAYAADYRLETSLNGTTWTPLLTVLNSDGGVENLTGLTGSGRFLRLTGTRRATAYGYSLWEMEVFGPAAPLPVTLTSFKAIAQSQAVALHWATATEHQNEGFAVQRSADGEQFTDLAFVPGAGTSQTPHQYAYFDEHPLRAATSYYRLRQLDAAGAATYGPVQAVQAATGAATAYPNPTKDVATVEWDAATEGPAHWTLTNTTGQVMRTEPLVEHAGRNVLPVDLRAYPPGSYILTLDGMGHSRHHLHLFKAE
ncbi:glycosyl hydrolase [Hymenobacter negativus]|uniref:Discoidin domain-containing protein n=1 Tax=Hymenobacter negativus TaxID=2795026 RepID=A0ABS3QLZ8_9BACT|nr:glycosyl hydrolase [Hymenobacter negativus]MBO2012300.1 discoidin domain-containing protein [Hymenobacter negativus]